MDRSTASTGNCRATPGERLDAARRRKRHLLSVYAILGGLLMVCVAVAGGLLATRELSAPTGAAPAPASVVATEATVSADAKDTEITDEVAALPVTSPTEPRRITIAWQPSHQGDTGFDGWREYAICGDLMERSIASLGEFAHIRAVTLEHGLTGSNSYQRGPSNTEAFDVEIALANNGAADAFISMHNDGGAPSGVLGMCMPGDSASRALAEQLVASICAATGLPNRGIREERLYSLEDDKNQAELRLLLEIGDNAKDRDLLEDADFRQTIAVAIAKSIRVWTW
ncbi:MAG: N-acetylmuramoyl-L-alanine amidase [Coriobacteriia bacterium]